MLFSLSKHFVPIFIFVTLYSFSLRGHTKLYKLQAPNPRPMSSAVEGRKVRWTWVHVACAHVRAHDLFFSLSHQAAKLGLNFQIMCVEESSLGAFTCPREKIRYTHQGFPAKLLGQITLHSRQTLFTYSQLPVSCFVPSHMCEQTTKNYHTSKGSI